MLLVYTQHCTLPRPAHPGPYQAIQGQGRGLAYGGVDLSRHQQAATIKEVQISSNPLILLTAFPTKIQKRPIMDMKASVQVRE